MSLIQALKEKILILDGAIGTELRRRSFSATPPDLANVLSPKLVETIHREYAQSGADVHQTNTFSSNRIKLLEAGKDIQPAEIIKAAVQIARNAISQGYLLGTIGPCGKPLNPMGPIESRLAFESFQEAATAFKNENIDAIVLESFTDLEELRLAVKAVRSITDLPIVALKSFIEDGETLSEGFPLRVAQEMLEMGIDIIGANCVVGPQRMHEIIRWMSESGETPICAVPTPGVPQLVRNVLTYDTTPEYFGKAAARLADVGANIIGGCCGTTPEFIQALSNALQNRKPRERSIVKTAKQFESKPPQIAPPSKLQLKLQEQKFIITVELDLPRGLDTSKVLEGAKSLYEKGVDLIDISDGARARLRMTPIAVSAIIQNQIGIEVMMHVACRDRNLLALQADLLGAHALGIKNVLAITGDPANIGDFPSATSVFDIDAVGLIRTLSRFNQGVDMAGNTIGTKCAFTIAAAFNPMAHDLKLESERLSRKIDAGLNIIYTQPLFDQKSLDIALEKSKQHNLPLFVGVMPLRSLRHAEFMHNEVPGIEIPEILLKTLETIDENDALEFGIEVAQKFATQVRTQAQGLYLMPPFGNHTIAERVLEAIPNLNQTEKPHQIDL